MKFPTIWDNWRVKENDWILFWKESLKSNIKELPTIDSIVYNWDQYVHDRHETSCTKFAYYNQRVSIFNHEGSWEEIDKVEEKSKDLGWKWPWFWWSSSYGADAVRETMWKVSKRQVTLFSEEWDLLMKKKRPVGISIRVDGAYWRDVKDGDLDLNLYKTEYWHADTIRKPWDNYEMLDSVHWYRYEITPEQLEALHANNNLRWYGYVLLPLDVFSLPNYIALEDAEHELEKHLELYPEHTIKRTILNRNRQEPKREKILVFLAMQNRNRKV